MARLWRFPSKDNKHKKACLRCETSDSQDSKLVRSVDNILAMCPQDTRLAKLGARLGYVLLAVAAFRCVLDVQERRNQEIDRLVNEKGYKRRDAEAETLPIYHKWLFDEIKNLVLEDWISDVLPLIVIPQEEEENKKSLMI